MLIVVASHPESLLSALRHHAKALEPVVMELLVWAGLRCGEAPGAYYIRQSRVGPNSWSLATPDGREYHVRGKVSGAPVGGGRLHVYDRARGGRHVATITSPAGARRFVEWVIDPVTHPAP